MKSPAFQFYPDDFIGGTITMSNEERGFYIMLLCLQWTQGSLTDRDFKHLANGMNDQSFQFVKNKFERNSDGSYYNFRLESVRSKQQEFRNKQSNAGKAGMEKRWKHNNEITNNITENNSGYNDPITSSITNSITKNNSLSSSLTSSSSLTPSITPSPYTPTKLVAATPTKAGKKLLGSELMIAKRFESALNGQWINDSGKWVKRIKQNTDKTDRVIAEVELAIREKRIATTPAQYAEQIWKEFA